MTNQEIANLINERIGPRPVPFDSVRALCLEIYQELGGTEDDEYFEDIYQILLAIIPLAQEGGGAHIDDLNVSTGTTWSSSKIVSELGNYATTNDVSAFITELDLPDFSNYATKDDISTFVTENDASIYLTDEDLNGYATEEFVNSSLANYATKDDISTFITEEDLPDLSDYATKNDISTFLEPNDVSIYATTEAVNQGLQLKQDTLIAGENITIQNNVISATGGGSIDPSNYYTKSEVDTKLSEKADSSVLGDYATKNDISTFITEEDLPDMSEYATKDDISTFITENDASVYLTENDLNGYATEQFVNSSLANYATKNDISTFITENDASIYATKSAVDASLQTKQDTLTAGTGVSITNNVISATAVGAQVVELTQAQYDALVVKEEDVIYIITDAEPFDASNYYTKTEINARLVNYVTNNDISTFITENDASIYLTDEDLVGYATEEFVNSSLANYATLNDISTFITENDASIYATKADVDASLANYATKDDISTFITENDASVYATKTYVDNGLQLKQDTLIAGDNITILNNVISATGGGSVDPSNYYTKSEVDASLALKADKTELDDFAKVVELTQLQYDNLATKDTSTLYIITDAEPIDTSSFYTKSEADAKFATKNDISTFITSNDISTFITENDVSAFLTDEDLEGYATEQFVNSSLANYATTNDISAFITQNDASVYLTSNDLNGYATESFVNSSLANYATTNDVSAFLTANDASVLYNPYNTVAANDAGTAWFPIWNARGQVVGHNWSAFRKDLTINGVAKKIWHSVLNDTISPFYAPTTAGTEGYCLVADSSGIPVWSNVLGDISTALATILGV